MVVSTVPTLLLALAMVPAAPRPAARMEGNVMIPATSIEQAEDIGVRMHTNYRIMLGPAKGLGPNGGMSPAQIRAFYGVTGSGAGVIAIVDAWDYPTALADFNKFSQQFGLPQETGLSTVFQVVYASGSKPDNSQASPQYPSAAWNQEAALDTQWAHAMAPAAKIVLVEAASDSYADLFAAVDAAVQIPGVKQISMSWADTESAGETFYDTHFEVSGPVLFNSVGDAGGVTTYPSSSQYVVAVGGTSVSTDSSGNWLDETAWSQGGGGDSAYVAKPAWQAMVSSANMTGSHRGTPDLAADADPQVSGVSVYDSTPYEGKSGWLVFGGTSVSAPCVAGMVNASGVAFTGTTHFLTTLYENCLKTPYPFRDITSGNNGFQALAGWDYATGVGAAQVSSGSFALNLAVVTGMDVLNLVGNLGLFVPALEVTGDAPVTTSDLDFMLLQLGW